MLRKVTENITGEYLRGVANRLLADKQTLRELV
jgi:hypothetical protein